MEEALYEIASLRNFAGLRLSEPIPDETTILNLRHMLEESDLAEARWPGSTKAQGWLASIGMLNMAEDVALDVRQSARAIGPLRLQTTPGRAAVLRIASDQRDEALIGQPLVLGAQAPARHHAALHARVQALFQPDGAGIEGRAADQADVLLHRDL